MNTLNSVLTWLWDGYWPTTDPQADLVARLQNAQDRYIPERLFAAGDVADLHLATAGDALDAARESLYLLKVARGYESNTVLALEAKLLARLSSAAGGSTYRDYLPALVDSFATGGRTSRQVNVFRFENGWHTLEQVHEQLPALDGRHLAWIFKRLLTVLGFSHRQKIIHAAVLPAHVLLDAATHGLKLIGWGQGVAEGRRSGSIIGPYRNWYPAEVERRQTLGPATDLFLAARCMVYLAGGDPTTNRIPEHVPRPMQRFLSTCLLESARMRADDAWALLEDFDELLQALYGPPHFHELTLT